MKNIVKRILSIILVVLLLTLCVFGINVQGIGQRWKFTFEVGVDISPTNGWCARYGGVVSMTDDRAFDGKYSLVLLNRAYSWQSQALNLDRIFTEGGVGVYKISAMVCVNNVNPLGRQKVRSIIRGTYDNSFIDASTHEGTVNYFTVLDQETTVEDQWVKLAGEVTVNNAEINVGTYYWMLDLIDVYDNQEIYVDNVEIYKVSDIAPTTSSNGVNYKPFEKGYNYVDIEPQLTEEMKASTYYSNMQFGYARGTEFILTLTEDEYNNLCHELTAIATDQYDQQKENELNDALKSTIFTFAQKNPSMALAGMVDDILGSIDTFFTLGADDIVNICLNANSIYTEPVKKQEDITYSFCFHVNTYENFNLVEYFEYKIQSSTGMSAWGPVNEDIQNYLLALCLYYQNNNDHISTNKTYVEYSYGG